MIWSNFGIIHSLLNAKFFEKLIFLTSWYAHVRVHIGIRNISFLEIFVFVLNEWALLGVVTHEEVQPGPPAKMESFVTILNRC